MTRRFPTDPDEASKVAEDLAEKEAPRAPLRPPDKRRRFPVKRHPDTKEG